MRFVHMECLSQWRKLSANPLSSHQCDNCQYRYSFRRTLYASVLRSALVLHLVTLLLLLLLLLVASWATQLADTHVFGGSILEMNPFELPHKELSMLADAAGSGGLVTAIRWLGIDASYFVCSLFVVGATGFLTVGALGPMLCNQDTVCATAHTPHASPHTH